MTATKQTVPPFIIVVDTREQLPYRFDGFSTARRKLDAGDYGLELPDGTLAPIAFERKSHSDLWGSMGAGRARFERCVRRMAELDFAAIVIEATLAQACIPPRQIQRVQTSSVIGGLISWSVQHGVHVWFGDSRIMCERLILRGMAAWYRHSSGLYRKG